MTYLHPVFRAQPGEDPRGAAVPRAAHADGDRRRRVLGRRGRSAPPGHGLEALRLAHGAPPGPPLCGDGRAGDHRPGRRHHLGAAGGLRQLRFSREPLGVLRLPRLCERLAEAPLPGGVPRLVAQLPAHGLLGAAHPRGGRPAPRGGRPRPGREQERGGGLARAGRPARAGHGGRARRTARPRLGERDRRPISPRRSPPAARMRTWRISPAGAVSAGPLSRHSPPQEPSPGSAGRRPARYLVSWHPVAPGPVPVGPGAVPLTRREALWAAGAAAEARPDRLPGHRDRDRCAAASRDGRDRGDVRRSADARAVTRLVPDGLRQGEARSPGGGPQCRARAGARRGQGARGRRGDAPATAGYGRGDDVSQPGGRDGSRERHLLAGMLDPLPQGGALGRGAARPGAARARRGGRSRGAFVRRTWWPSTWRRSTSPWRWALPGTSTDAPRRAGPATASAPWGVPPPRSTPRRRRRRRDCRGRG